DPRIQFTESFTEAEDADLMLVSGSLHYFDRPLGELLAGLKSKPRHILINRAPLIEGPTSATVQDGGDYRVPCKLLNRNELMESLTSIGYKVVDTWMAPELSLKVIGKRAYSAVPYSGAFLRHQAAVGGAALG